MAQAPKPRKAVVAETPKGDPSAPVNETPTPTTSAPEEHPLGIVVVTH